MVLIDSVEGKQSRVACHAAFLSHKFVRERARRSNSRDFPTKNTHTHAHKQCSPTTAETECVSERERASWICLFERDNRMCALAGELVWGARRDQRIL